MLDLIFRINHEILENPDLNEEEKIEGIKNICLKSNQFYCDEAGKFWAIDIENGFPIELTRKKYVTTSKPCTLLGMLAKEKYLLTIKWLVEEQGADIDQGNTSQSPLCIAAQSGQIEVMRYLIEQGANVDFPYREPFGDNRIAPTPLHFAIQFGYPEAVALLLKHNVNKNLPSMADQHAFYLLKSLYAWYAEKKGFYSYWRDTSKIPSIETMIEILGILAPGLQYAYQFECYEKSRSSTPLSAGEKAAAEDYIYHFYDMSFTIDTLTKNKCTFGGLRQPKGHPVAVLNEVMKYIFLTPATKPKRVQLDQKETVSAEKNFENEGLVSPKS